MGEIAALRHVGADEHESRAQLLVADDDALARSELASCVRDAVGEMVVVEAQDGAEAIQLALQRSPDIAILDVNMPRLNGIDAAITLRELRPRMSLGLQTRDPHPHRERAHTLRLPLFSKVELDRTLAWLRAQVERCMDAPSEREPARKLNFRCIGCGYGVLRSTPPQRCPMCQTENAWVYAPVSASTTALSR